VSCIFLGRRTESVEFDDEDLGLSDVVPTPRPAAVPTPVGS
jgi:hypothetical protein